MNVGDFDHLDSESPPPPAKRSRQGDESEEPNERNPFDVVVRSEKARELIEFVKSLDRLGELLYGAVKELDDQALDELQGELCHDWRVEEMATFVEGFFKGARKRSRPTC